MKVSADVWCSHSALEEGTLKRVSMADTVVTDQSHCVGGCKCIWNISEMFVVYVGGTIECLKGRVWTSPNKQKVLVPVSKKTSRPRQIR